MANVWFAFEGDRPTIGDAKTERPLAECVDLLRITENRYLGDEPKKVRFNPGQQLATIAGYKHVIVEVEAKEVQGGWKVGFYHSPLSPTEAMAALGL
jgi:hypothetical protein